MPVDYSGWQTSFLIIPHGLPPVPRVVINVSYTWPQQLFASHLGLPNALPTIPEGIEEIVFHFKKFGDRARYLLLHVEPSIDMGLLNADLIYAGLINAGLTFHIDVRGTFTSSSPPPVLGPAEYIAPVIAKPVHKDLFSQIAELYADAVGKGKRGTRDLRLTMVGLAEFDAARDADAADEVVFARIVDSLLWDDGVVPRPDDYEHHPYEPVAPTFVEQVTDLVHHKKYERVRRNVKVLSSTEYLAGLKHPADEDWWDMGAESKCQGCHAASAGWV